MTMIELRILFIIGLLVTAALAYVAVLGTFAAVGWLRHQGERVFGRQALVKATVPQPGSRAGTTPMRTDAERRVHLRQAAWRLRC